MKRVVVSFPRHGSHSRLIGDRSASLSCDQTCIASWAVFRLRHGGFACILSARTLWDRYFEASELLSTDAEPDEPLTTEATSDAVCLHSTSSSLSSSMLGHRHTQDMKSSECRTLFFSVGAHCSCSMRNQTFLHDSPTSQRLVVFLSRFRQGLGHLYFVRTAGATGAECKVC